MENKYDIFISYRRIGGKEYARTLKPELEKRGFRVFLDFDELNDGVFDQRIKDAISNSPVFLIILSNGALDRCVNDGDWIREEILYANKCNCHIIPVEFDKSFRKIPETIPDVISSIIGAHSWSQIDTESLLQESIDKMVQKRIKPFTIKEDSLKEGIEIHIDIDADCNLFRFNTFVRHLKTGNDNIIYLPPGKYRFNFVSTQVPEVKSSLLYELLPNKNCDYIEIRIKKMIETEIERRKEEEEYPKKLIRLKDKILHHIKKNGKYGYADEEGVVVIPCKWDWAQTPFVEDLALVKNSNGKYGFIDKAGKEIIPCQWQEALAFYEGLAAVKNDYEKWGYIDKTNNVVIQYRWSDVSIFTEGLARVKDDNNYHGYIDKTGETVIQCKWKNAHSFSEGLAAVKDINNKWGFIDKTGELVIQCQWENVVKGFQEGIAKVFDSGIHTSLIDKNGKVIGDTDGLLKSPE